MSTMAAPPPQPTPHTGSVGPDTLITCKVLIDGTNRRFKLALRDLGANTLPQKLRFLLAIPPERDVKFDRFSDSAGAYISLDSTNPAVYKQLYRAAKAKLKLRLRATVVRSTQTAERSSSGEENIMSEPKQPSSAGPRQSSYLETVLSHIPALATESAAPSQLDVSTADSCVEQRNLSKTATGFAQLSRPTLPSLHDFSCNIFSIDCNSCKNSIPNEHYHCSICERGDFDLCQSCVDNGATCNGDEHWLIKRSIKNGHVVPSITEIVSPKLAGKSALSEESQSAVSIFDEEERTCNSCINQFHASSFVSCKDCPDFDLCFSCFEHGDHGHHPAHVFHPMGERPTTTITALCGAGRGLRHDAICDGCDKQIIGIRHKCLSCPDFDYCPVCVTKAAELHPVHRFAPIFEQLPALQNYFRKEVHRGIYCDGALCAGRPRKSWIKGDRYKCAICHDTDFCSNCEASPTFDHNKTHPLIKIKTPIHSFHVSTFEESDRSEQPIQLGDRPRARHASTETTRPTSINAATQVQTVAEVKPAETKVVETPKTVASKVEAPAPADLQAWFMSDSTPDGSNFAPNHLVSQSWTLRNPGPQTWPAGCAVYFTGGDDMRNLDMKHPSSVSEMTIANRSNILERPLEPGQTAVFTVMLRSPPRECRAISYWRLKTPDGDAFGHKLWVDITVANKTSVLKESVSAAPVPDPFHAEAEDQAQQSSTMIFPRLDKESPDSSIHNVSSGMSVTTAAETMAANQQKELIDDLESLNFEEDEATEDGFLTDDEYDILDADDEDLLAPADRVGA